MNRILIVLSVVALTILPALAAEAETEIPTSLCNIKLGSDISEYRDIIISETSQPIWKNEELSRVSVHELTGFRSGYITYGNCAVPGRVVRVKLTLEDTREQTFKRLLEAYRDRFGDDPEWRGDPFGTLKVWKWDLDDDGHNISLILQYYSGTDDNFTIGTTIRIADRNMMQEEADCFKKQHGNMHKMKKGPQDGMPLDWFIPK